MTDDWSDDKALHESFPGPEKAMSGHTPEPPTFSTEWPSWAAAELERANARIEELVNVLTIISTANVPINRNDFPRAFDTLRAIAQDALASATPNTAQQIEHETKSYDAGNRDGKATMREMAAKEVENFRPTITATDSPTMSRHQFRAQAAAAIRSLPLDPDSAKGESSQ